MADERISEVAAKPTLHDTDLVPIVDIEADPDTTKHITGANMKSQVLAGHKDLTTGVHGVGAGTVGILNKDTKIIDADGDTGIEVEQAADEDKVHIKTKGVECGLFSDVGILTLAKQSGFYASYAGGQYLDISGKLSYLLYDTEAYDIQGEFDNTVKTGTASATSASHLIDATLSPFVAGDVGSFVWNTTDNTYAKVTAYNSASDVTLDENIMVSGEGYKLYASKFTAKEAGLYIAGAFLQLSGNSDDGQYLIIKIDKNWTTTPCQGVVYASAPNQYLSPSAITPVQLAANDYLTFTGVSNADDAKRIFTSHATSYAFVAKIA